MHVNREASGVPSKVENNMTVTTKRKADRGPPDLNIREAIRTYLTDAGSLVKMAEVEAAIKSIIRLCRSNCKLFIPGEYYIESPWETANEFVGDWVADQLAQLHEPDLTRLDGGDFDYWPHACRRDLLNEIAKAQRKLAVLNPVSLSQEREQEDGIFRHDPCESYWTKHAVKLRREQIIKYCEENRAAFKKLGRMGEVIVAFAHSFPLPPSARSIAKELGVTERQARRYLQELPMVMQKEIATGNSIVRGLFALLRTGDVTLTN
jgi:hypothetical protein